MTDAPSRDGAFIIIVLASHYATALNPATSAAATSPFTYDMTSNAPQFFRLAH